ncbi:hypothetical protein [Sinomicrobium sp. M5D2P17]
MEIHHFQKEESNDKEKTDITLVATEVHMGPKVEHSGFIYKKYYWNM